MSDDDFTLGTFIVDDDFSLGEIMFEPKEEAEDVPSEKTNLYSDEEKNEVRHIYELLVSGKSPKVKFKEYFHTNVNIFEVAGKVK